MIKTANAPAASKADPIPPILKYIPIINPPLAMRLAAATDPGQTSRQASFTSGNTK
jgi:hypothetical protein